MLLPTGSCYWVCNVYLPPAANLRRRGLQEEDARTAMLDVLSDVPHADSAVVCGDFNARLGTLAPQVCNVQVQRACADVHTCARGKWLVQ